MSDPNGPKLSARTRAALWAILAWWLIVSVFLTPWGGRVEGQWFIVTPTGSLFGLGSSGVNAEVHVGEFLLRLLVGSVVLGGIVMLGPSRASLRDWRDTLKSRWSIFWAGLDRKICTHCGDVIGRAEPVRWHDGKVYHDGCFKRTWDSTQRDTSSV